MKLDTIQAAIVDLDGTMIDTQGDFVMALNATMDAMKLSHIDAHFVSQTVGKGSEYLIRSTLTKVCADASRYEEARALYQTNYLRINGDHSTVYPGVIEGLKKMRARGWKLACLTNKPNAFAVPLLQKKGLSDYFSKVFGGDAFERMKPDPLPLLKTCEALGTSPSHTLMIGDSSNDARAARAAGCPVMLVTYGYNHGVPVHTVDADGFLDRIDALQ
jgi:phosphoglycolate phosphatase